MSWRLVLDTNIFYSGLLYGGTPRRFLDMLPHPRIHCISSELLLSELQSALLRKSGMNSSQAAEAITRIRALAELVHSTETPSVCRDPDDDHVLECAVAGHADAIVTGDRDLLALVEFRGIRILTLREFLARISA